MLEINHNNPATSQRENNKKITIQGTLTSSLQLRGEGSKEPYYYAFVRLKGQKIDLPVIFKLNDKLLRPPCQKSAKLQLTGYYCNSDKSVRKSFTCCDYQILKKLKKNCFGCGDNFTCSSVENYDYCENCELNGSRYLTKNSQCPECDGSGTIQFPNQPPRTCKTCYLAQQEAETKKNIFPQ